MSENRRYRQVLSIAAEQPWAILPSTLMVIREVIARHLAGERFTAEEIEARIGGGRPKPNASGDGSAVAVVPLWGVLVPHAGMMIDVSQEGTGLDAWLAGFREAVANPEVGSILLHVDSPGGSTGMVTEAAAVVREARKKKPIYAVANTLAASAAYAIASQAEQLYVTPSGMVGSIGVYTIHEDLSGHLEQQGVKPTVISAPKDGYKFENNPFGPLSPEAEQHLQAQVDDYYDVFVRDVAAGRGVDSTVVEEQYGKGRALNARAALRAGMVDGIATYDEVLAAMLKGTLPGKGARAELDTPAVQLAPAAPIGAPALAVGATAPVMAAGPHGPSGAPAPQASIVREGEQPEAPEAAQHDLSHTTEGGTMEPDVAEATAPAPTLEQHAARLDAIRTRQAELDTAAAGRELNAEEQAEFDQLTEEFISTERTIKNIKERKAHLARTAQASTPEPGVEEDRHVIHTNAGGRTPDNLFDLAEYRKRARSLDEQVALWHDAARRVNESLAYETDNPDKVRAFVERLLAKDPSDKPSESFAHRMLTAANPVYDSAYGKHVMGKQLTAHEEAVFKAAVSNTGLGSETPVPITIDPTVLLTTDGATNPLRTIARTVTITGNKWQGISSDGVSVVYEAELSTVADQTPNFDAPTAEVAKAHGWVEFSIEVDQDWGNFRSELARMFQDAKDVKESNKFLFGDGTDEPQGLLSYFDADDAQVIDSDSAGAIGLVDYEALAGDLPPRFDSNAVWLANKSAYQGVRALAAAASRFDVWVQLAQGFGQTPGGSGAQPYTLLGYPTYVASDMSKQLTTAGQFAAVLGDFSRGFIIVDRIGLNTELVPLVPSTGGRPRGSRGLYAYFRNTSQVLVPNAFRILRVAQS